MAFGEGWHNNHHAFPRSAFHGLHWWQFDVSGYVIWTLERLDLAREVYRIPPTLLTRRAVKAAQEAMTPTAAPQSDAQEDEALAERVG